MWVCFGLVYVEVSEEFDASTGQELERGEQESARGEVEARGLLKARETGLKCSGKGLFIPSNPCPVWGGKGTLSLFLPFFHTGVGTEQARPCGFPSKFPLQPGSKAHSCARTRGRQRVGAALGHLSGLCSCFGFSPACLAVPPRLSWAGRCRLLLSAPAVPGRVCGVWRWWLLLPEPFPSLN